MVKKPVKFSFVLSLFTLLICLGLTLPVQAANTSTPDFVPGKVIVVLKDGKTLDNTSTRSALATKVKYNTFSELGKTKKPLKAAYLYPNTAKKTVLFSLKENTKSAVLSAVAQLKNDPNVAYAQPDYILKMNRTTNDSYFGSLYYLDKIQAKTAWDRTIGSPSVVVALPDTGIDYTHEDLAANIWTNPGEIAGNGIDDDGNGYIDDVRGWDFCNNDNDPMDDEGHGTNCAGIIAAVGNNAKGVVGVAWGVKVAAIKWMSSSGNGTTSAAISAINYAAAMGMPIINLSWGSSNYSQALKDAINAASNCLFVANAGSNTRDIELSPYYPASFDCPNIISVSATDQSDNLTSTSSWGKTSVDLAAPGADVLSCWPGNTYRSFTGTSMASPQVSAAAALLKSISPTLTAQETKSLLLSRVDKLSSLTGKVASEGRLNINNAINAKIAKIRITGTSTGGGGGGYRWYKIPYSAPKSLCYISPKTSSPVYATTDQTFTLTTPIYPGESFAIAGSEGSGSCTRTFTFYDENDNIICQVSKTFTNTGDIVATLDLPTSTADTYSKFYFNGAAVTSSQETFNRTWTISIAKIQVTGASLTGSGSPFYWYNVNSKNEPTYLLGEQSTTPLSTLTNQTFTMPNYLPSGTHFSMVGNESSGAGAKTFTFYDQYGNRIAAISKSITDTKTTVIDSPWVDGTTDEYTDFCFDGSTITTTQKTMTAPPSRFLNTSASYVDLFQTKPNFTHNSAPYFSWIYPDKTDTHMVINWGRTTAHKATIQIGHYPGGATVGKYTCTVAKYQYSFVIQNLSPNTTYYFRVTDELGNIIIGDTAFKTAPSSTGSFSFVQISDSQTKNYYGGEVSDTIAVATALNNDQTTLNKTSFILHTGDLVGNGADLLQWKSWFSDYYYNVLSKKPLLAISGNHDYYNNTAATNLIKDLFAFPGQEMYYQFDVGKARFICLECGNYDLPFDFSFRAGEQAFIDSSLNQAWQDKQSGKINFIFVAMHCSIGSVGFHGIEAPIKTMRDAIKDKLRDYGVDFVMTGHDHTAQRNIMNGITYIVGGTGGGYQDGANGLPTDKPQLLPTELKNQFFSAGFGYHVYDVSQNEVSVSFKKTDGTTAYTANYRLKTIYYHNPRGWQNVYIDYANAKDKNGVLVWTVSPGRKMVSLGNGWYKYTMPVEKGTNNITSLTCKFSDGATQIDNNNGSNYTVVEDEKYLEGTM